MEATRGWKTTWFQHFLVFGVFVVFLSAWLLLCIIILMCLLLISHKHEKFLFRRPRRRLCRHKCTAITHWKTYFTFSPLYPAFPCVYKTRSEKEGDTQQQTHRAQRTEQGISEKEEMEKFFCLHPRVLTTAHLPRLRPDPATRPVRSHPTRKAPLVRFWGQRKRPWFVKQWLMVVKEKQAANLLSFQPGAAVFSRSPLFALQQWEKPK